MLRGRFGQRARDKIAVGNGRRQLVPAARQHSVKLLKHQIQRNVIDNKVVKAQHEQPLAGGAILRSVGGKKRRLRKIQAVPARVGQRKQAGAVLQVVLAGPELGPAANHLYGLRHALPAERRPQDIVPIDNLLQRGQKTLQPRPAVEGEECL
ncbi:MAG: hypothetical protein XXXJIFNMEKO3_00540 [Candidatus Erwinia impunctatus]